MQYKWVFEHIGQDHKAQARLNGKTLAISTVIVGVKEDKYETSNYLRHFEGNRSYFVTMYVLTYGLATPGDSWRYSKEDHILKSYTPFY